MPIQDIASSAAQIFLSLRCAYSACRYKQTLCQLEDPSSLGTISLGQTAANAAQICSSLIIPRELSNFTTADKQSIASSSYALKKRDEVSHQASGRFIHQPRRSSTVSLNIPNGHIIFSKVRPSIWNLSSRFGTLRLYAGQVRPSVRCARRLVSAVLRFPATLLISTRR